MKLGLYKEAHNYFSKALEIDKEYSSALLNSGICYERQKMYSKAIKEYEEVINIGERKSDAYFNLGLLYQRTELYEKARNSFVEALKLNPQDYVCWFEKGTCEEKLNSVEKSLDSYSSFLKYTKRFEKKKIRHAVKKIVEAYSLEFADQFIGDNSYLKSYFFTEYYNKAIKLSKIGKYLEANIFINKAINIFPGESIPIFEKGNNYKNLKDFRKAIECYKQCLIIEPQNEKVWTKLAESEYQLGDYLESIKSSEKALKLNNKLKFAWYNKGNCLRKLGKISEAIKCYERSLDIDPNFSLAIKSKNLC